MLVSVSHDSHVKIWDALSGKLRNKQLPLRHSGWIFALAMSPTDAGVCASGGEDGLHVWDLERHEDRCHIRLAECGSVHALSFCAGGTLMAVLKSGSAAPELWTLQGQQQATLRLPGADKQLKVTAMVCSHSEKWVALGSETGGLLVRDLDTSAAVRQHASATAARAHGQAHGVSAVAFDADGQSLLWAAGNNALWRREPGCDQPQSGESLPQPCCRTLSEAGRSAALRAAWGYQAGVRGWRAWSAWQRGQRAGSFRRRQQWRSRWACTLGWAELRRCASCAPRSCCARSRWPALRRLLQRSAHAVRARGVEPPVRRAANPRQRRRE